MLWKWGKKKAGFLYARMAILLALANWTEAGSKINTTQAGVCSRRDYAAETG